MTVYHAALLFMIVWPFGIWLGVAVQRANELKPPKDEGYYG